MPEEASVTFDPEVDLNDDAVGRSRYKRFYPIRSSYARENLSLKDVRKSPVEWGAFERTFARNWRTHFKEYPKVFQNS